MQLQLKELQARVPVIRIEGDIDLALTHVVSIGDPETTRTSLFWCSDKNRDQLLQVEKGIVIISKESHEFLLHSGKPQSWNITWIIVEKPRQAFMQVLQVLQEGAVHWGFVAESARIHPSVVYNREQVFIGENVVIEAGVKLGNHVYIHHNTVIMADTVAHDRVKIGSNCTIGGVGFGYELNDEGQYELIPHIGNVVLHTGAEIGNNTCIDRAVLGSTVIGENVKIDNLVHIAHGVQVGKNSLVIANAMIAGSVTIGENCWIAPSVSVIQKTSVGEDTIVGLGSVVIRDVESHAIYAGIPAKKLRDK